MENSPITINWDALREEGLKYLQMMSGRIWTDYNIHDPGVTIFEALCCAISDLQSRLSQNIETILSEGTPSQTQQQFFSPGEILTSNPVTINDYRKLLIDIPGVKNAWLAPAIDNGPSLYYDRDNNVLLYDYVSGSQRITLNGLYRVFIEKDEGVKDEAQLKQTVIEVLHAHRNLCEDFTEVKIMEQELISVFTDIQISENADANEVMAQIYYDLQNFISPRVRQYSLPRMLKKGKTIEQIFNGPQLENGFIDDDELGTGEKRKELHTSDLIGIIMGHPEVKNINNFFIANVPNPDLTEKQEWVLVLDDTKALLLEDFNSSKIRLFWDEKTLCPINTSEVIARISSLKSEKDREIFDDPAMDFTMTFGDNSISTDYEPISSKLPAVYGVSEAGLPLNASDQRKAQAKQLQAYLLFFDQILVNYLQQLNQFKHIFAFHQNRTEILKTYFSQLLPPAIWQEDYPEIIERYQYLEDDPGDNVLLKENAFKRKNRILNHLLALFNERFADYALFGFKYNTQINLTPEAKQTSYLTAKANFLEQYSNLSRNRNLAHNYLLDAEHTDTDGLKKMLAAKLGLGIYTEESTTPNEWESFFIVEHILLRPAGSLFLNFICSEKIAEKYQPDPYSYKLSFIIPKRTGRFSNSKFKELVYATIAKETPAHISYTILEFDTAQMNDFADTYQCFLRELRQNRLENLNLNNSYRNQMIRLLGIGQVKLPILHLDAYDITGDGIQPNSQTPVEIWKDLSLNHHDAKLITTSKPKYLKLTETAHPGIRFEDKAQLQISSAFSGNDYTIIIVYMASVAAGFENQYCNILAATNNSKVNFSLRFKGTGGLNAAINDEKLTVESTVDVPHIAIFTYAQETAAMHLYMDGVLESSRTLTNTNISFTAESLIIGPDTTASGCELKEVIILDSGLTRKRRQILENYLSVKWNIPLSVVSSVGKPVLHLDSSDSRHQLIDVRTNKISQWQDLSSNMLISQQDPTFQPEYVTNIFETLPAVYFNNSSLIIPMPQDTQFFTANFTLLIVYWADAGSGCLLDGSKVANNKDQTSFAISLNQKGDLMVRIASEELTLAGTIAEPHIAIISGDIGNSNIHELELSLCLDGKSYVRKTFTNVDDFRTNFGNFLLGMRWNGQDGFCGYMAEIIFYNQTLTELNRQTVANFLAEKWRIDLSGVDPIAVPLLHLDASRLMTVLNEEETTVYSEDPKVYRWADLSRFQNDVIQTNINKRPTFNSHGIQELGAVSFTQQKSSDDDYYDDYLSLEPIIQKDFTMILVFKPEGAIYLDQNSPLVSEVDEQTQWKQGVAIIAADCYGKYNDFGISFGKKGDKMVIMSGVGDRLTGDYTLKTDGLDFLKAHLITFSREYATGNIKLYANGSLQAQAVLRNHVLLNDAREIKIGAYNSGGIPFCGYFGEINIFDHVLSNEEQQEIEAYLSAKWEIEVATLPIAYQDVWLHLDAAKGNSISRDKNNMVSRWGDANSLANLGAVQKSSANQPVYSAEFISGKPAIRFNNSFMNITASGITYDQFTIVMVYHALSSGNIYPTWEYGAGIIDNYLAGTNQSFGIAITRENQVIVRIGTNTIKAEASLNEPHIALISRNSIDGEVKLYIDGVCSAKGNFMAGIPLNGSPVLTIGAVQQVSGQSVSNGYYHGDIAEIIVFKTVLNQNDQQLLEQYLSGKWEVDISGIDNIANSLIHLDASKLNSINMGTDLKVAKWLDKNGYRCEIDQINPDKRPVYKPNAYNGQAVIHFDGHLKQYLILPRLVQDDFTIVLVYKAEPSADSTEYEPIAPAIFTTLTGVDQKLAQTIWTALRDKGWIDYDGNVLPSFTPRQAGFTLGFDANLYASLRPAFETELASLLSNAMSANKPVTPDMLTAIPGLDLRSATELCNQLQDHQYLDKSGKVLTPFTAGKEDFIQHIIESAMINLIITNNWIYGVGLLDGNCAGDWADLRKRDFGILVDKDGSLIAGIGEPGENDIKITAKSSFGQLHIGIFTREKDSGTVRLYLDGAEPVQAKAARNVTLQDANSLTIGAVNTGGRYFTGDIAEIIIFENVLLDSQIMAIQKYLAKKWGLKI